MDTFNDKGAGMSADDVKAAFPAIRLELERRARLRELVRSNQFKKAAELKEQLDGPLPRRQVITLRHKSQR